MKPVVLVLGPHRDAVSGVSTQLNLLLASPLAEEFSLIHFRVGSEAQAIGRLAVDRESPGRMGIACRRRIARCYSVERLSREFRNLYVDICASRQARALPRF